MGQATLKNLAHALPRVPPEALLPAFPKAQLPDPPDQSTSSVYHKQPQSTPVSFESATPKDP